MSDYLERVGANIKRLREKRGLTQSGLAAETGLCQSVIARLEAGKSNPTVRTLRKISEALVVSMGSLL